MGGQTEPDFSPADSRSDLAHSDPKLGEFLASFAPQVTEVGFETHPQRRNGVTLALIAGCAVIGLAGYELVKHLSRKRQNSQVAQPDVSA